MLHALGAPSGCDLLIGPDHVIGLRCDPRIASTSAPRTATTLVAPDVQHQANDNTYMEIL